MTEPNIPKNVVDNQELKVCSTCNVSFPATKEYFYWRSDNNKLRNQCKKCKTKTDRLWQQKNREHISTYCRKKDPKIPNTIMLYVSDIGTETLKNGMKFV